MVSIFLFALLCFFFKIFGRKKKKNCRVSVLLVEFLGRSVTYLCCTLVFKLTTTMTRHYEIQDVWEKIMYHDAELMRLNTSDNLGVRDEFPFLLLQLNRDADAYQVASLYICCETGNTPHPNEPPEVGTWDHDDSDMMDDPLIDGNAEKATLHFLVAIAIIKLRLAAYYDQCRDQKTILLSHENIHSKSWFGQLKNQMEEKFYGRYGIRLANQADHAMRLLEVIKRINRILLCAFLDPAPLQAQGQPQYRSRGTSEEAASILPLACRHIARIPGAHERIKNVLGPSQSYDPKFYGYHD